MISLADQIKADGDRYAGFAEVVARDSQMEKFLRSISNELPEIPLSTDFCCRKDKPDGKNQNIRR